MITAWQYTWPTWAVAQHRLSVATLDVWADFCKSHTEGGLMLRPTYPNRPCAGSVYRDKGSAVSKRIWSALNR